jgi:hypothetical protein
VLFLVGAGSALAADPNTRVTAKPLWDAYPLDTRPPTTTAKTADESAAPPQASTTATLIPLDRPRAQSAPIAVLVLFYSAIAGLIIGVGVLALRQLKRSRTQRTPTGASHG